ncbi:kinase-like protein [Trametes coccinea BRFM310]|uniref:Kinase-like protein n=1 Tax=Trametes coccinea (strain BRFM310) TaxID=1353009 RepID=A0A1Y2INI4_TRAC3|nr:kinase-like protein [Trametes coccinea BRFM310]
MSFLRAIFSYLVPGGLTGKNQSLDKVSSLPTPGLYSVNGSKSVGPTLPCSAASSRFHWVKASSTGSSNNNNWENIERCYGLGFTVAKSLGLPSPLRHLSYTIKLASTENEESVADLCSPFPLCLNFPETPASARDGLSDPHPSCFARATPPKINWTSSPDSRAASPETRATSALAHPDTLYRSVLQQYFALPPPRLIHIHIPSYESVRASAEQSNSGEVVANLTHAGTQPAWSRSACASDLFTDGRVAVDGPSESEDDYPELDGETLGEGEDDCDEIDPSLMFPQHPNGTAYDLIGKLGEGGFGRVMLAATSEGELVALKVVHKPMLYENCGSRNSLVTERDLMAMATKYKLPFLMHLKAAWEEGDNVYFAMELCAEDLRSRIKRSIRGGQKISAREAKLLCMEMVLALVDLEVIETVHGDIKPDNFLVTKSGRVVLSDLGGAQCALALDTSFDPCVTPFHEWDAPYAYGTPGYYAPEALCRDRGAEDATFTSKVDVFSLGLVFAELLCGLEAPLWDTLGKPKDLDVDLDTWREMGSTERQAARMMTEGLRHILDGDRIADEDARDLVCQMLLPNPKDRPTAHELLRHRYFSDLDVESVRTGLVPHEYRPHFLGKLDRETTDVAFRTWLRRKDRKRVAAPEEHEPLNDFTWPELYVIEAATLYETEPRTSLLRTE